MDVREREIRFHKNMKNSVLFEKFSKNYLVNLNLFLDSNKFKNKIENLPIIKSTATNKLEKMIEKETKNISLETKSKSIINNTHIHNYLANNSIDDVTINDKINKENKQNKSIEIRYIIIEPENHILDLNNIDENYDYASKIINPYKVYLLEENENLKKKAIEQIIENAMSLENGINISNKSKIENVNSQDSEIGGGKGYTRMISGKILFYLENQLIKRNNSDASRENLNFENFMKLFNENCEIHGIHTIDQKIDYFVYLKNTERSTLLGSRNRKVHSKNPSLNFHKKKNRESISIYNKSHLTGINVAGNGNNKNDINFNLNQTHSSTNGLGLSAKNTISIDIISPLNVTTNKTIYPDTTNNNILDPRCVKISGDQDDKFYHEIITKVSQSQSQTRISNESLNILERIKQYLNIKEVTSEKVILRESDITHDRLNVLVIKKLFDFKTILHLNISKNSIDDTGGAYLLNIIKISSKRLDYLNISYNRLGKQSCEILTDILEKNHLKLSSLNIGGNLLGDKLFSEICVGVSKNFYLLKLSTNENNLGKISSTILGTILRYDKKLKYLDVSKNNFDDEIISQLLKGLISNVSLETLFLNENNLTNHSLRFFETTFTINSSVKEIFIEKNKFTSKGGFKLAEILNKNKSLEFISIVGNKFTNDNLDNILLGQKIPVKVILKTDFFHMKMNSKDKINFFEYIY